MMRSLVFSLLIFLGFSNLSAQAWEILNYNLKVAKENDQLSISLIDERNKIMLKGDTAFIDEGSGLLFYRDNFVCGIVDPYDLVLLQEATLRSLQTISDQIYIVEDEQGFYVSTQEFPLKRISDYFESAEPYREGPENPSAINILLVEQHGKFGMIVPELALSSYVLKPKYDEIIVEEAGYDSFRYKVRKGEKWGAGNEKGIEIIPKYDQLHHIGGDWGTSSYIAWRGGYCGVVVSYGKKPVVGLEYSFLSYLEKEQTTYLFLFQDEELVGMKSSDDYDEWDDTYEPLLIAHFGTSGKKVLIYKYESELLSFEITDDEIQRLGLASMDWMYFDN